MAVPIRRRAAAGLFAGIVWIAGSAMAVDLSSPGFRHRGGSFGAIGAGPLVSTGGDPVFLRSTAALGSNGVLMPSGRSDSLRSLLPGLAWLQASSHPPYAPDLDLDGDGLSHFFDDDDDGDGLLDLEETNTGQFVAAHDTGTSPLRVDSDGDGVPDGIEVASGSDPTDPESSTGGPSVPLLGVAARGLLIVFLMALGSVFTLFPSVPTRLQSTRKGDSQ